MDTANFAQQRKTVPGLQGLIVRGARNVEHEIADALVHATAH